MLRFFTLEEATKTTYVAKPDEPIEPGQFTYETTFEYDGEGNATGVHHNPFAEYAWEDLNEFSESEETYLLMPGGTTEAQRVGARPKRP